jgi:hypothetical protein
VTPTFAWAARPDAFAGEAGAGLVNVATGPAGLISLSSRDQGDGKPATRLWTSPDGVAWLPVDPAGLPEQPVIDGIWGAAGSYWLAGRSTRNDGSGSLWRSTDGRSWRPSLDLDPDLQVWSIDSGCASNAPASPSCPVFLTGTVDFDGAIFRSTDGGESWHMATVKDATGWKGTQDGAPVEIRGVVETTDALLAFGNGLPKASDTSGFLQSRFWRSPDGGVTWSRLADVAPFGELVVGDVAANGQVVVAVGDSADGPSMAVALRSTDGGATWSLPSMSGRKAEGGLSQVIASGNGFIGLGFASPAQVDRFPVREFVWTSEDGASWSTGPAGALDGGIVDDAIRVDNQIVAVGRGWTSSETGTWDAPFGPAVWTLES